VKVAILFDNFGPYHLARLKAASGRCDVLAVEFGASSAEYDWVASDAPGLKRVVLNQHGSSRALGNREFASRIAAIFNEFRPEVVVVPGWGYRGALLSLLWCVRHRVPAIVMSESTAWDETRSPFKEWIKSLIVSNFSAALVGGTPHKAYLEKLGFPEHRIFLGYDAVDNSFFSEGVGKSIEARESGDGGQEITSRPYFLASARFIEKKNLPRLIRAFASYRGKFTPSTTEPRFPITDSPWDLVLLGDGELRPILERLRSDLGLEDSLQMPGFKQYAELPLYYSGAGAFIHASTTEQWGLVVNEAMASGLPVLVSQRCGCASDLVEEGGNGWTFDPTDEGRLAELMLKISSGKDEREAMGLRSRRIIGAWSPERFAGGLISAIEKAQVPRRSLPAFLLSPLVQLVLKR
jgi:glycosyltransferase involved in cell wall biosynthesis